MKGANGYGLITVVPARAHLDNILAQGFIPPIIMFCENGFLPQIQGGPQMISSNPASVGVSESVGTAKNRTVFSQTEMSEAKQMSNDAAPFERLAKQMPA